MADVCMMSMEQVDWVKWRFVMWIRKGLLPVDEKRDSTPLDRRDRQRQQQCQTTTPNENDNENENVDDDDDVTDNVQRWKSKNNTQEAHPHEC
ncbi:GM25359 [Drosophila sechellia]|uniref:GM25359 n=1 Tax=Drosophila sechellia TaxID=7238 RepID=B4HG45_DROSE|nr:GM25359 [Drosophila sechellia]